MGRLSLKVAVFTLILLVASFASAGTYTNYLHLYKPDTGAIGHPNQAERDWGVKQNVNWDILDAAIALVVNVKAYGAKGDGITDDTAAINLALGTGGHIFIPKTSSYYKTTSGLTANIEGTFIETDGAEIRQVTGGAAGGTYNDAISTNVGINVTASNVTIRGLKISGPQHAAYNFHETGILASGTATGSRISNLTVDHCEINGWGMNGIRTRFVDNVSIHHNHVYDIVYQGIIHESGQFFRISNNYVHDITPGFTSNAYGIVAATGSETMATDPASSDGIIADNIVYNIPLWTGIDTHHGQRIAITGNSVYKCKIGITATTSSATTAPSNVTIVGNTVSAGGIAVTYYGIEVGGYDISTNFASNISVTGNTIDGYGTLGAVSVGGISVINIKGLTISGNIISNSTQAGVYLGSNTQWVSVTGNTIRGLAHGDGQTAGINVQGGVAGHVEGNHIDAMAEYALYAVGAGSTGLNFGPNTFISSNAGGPVYFGAADIGRGLEVFGTKSAWAPGTVSAGGGVSTTVVVVGANLGDKVEAEAADVVDTNSYLVLKGRVTAGGVVTLFINNYTAGDIPAISRDYYVKVIKH